MFEALSEHLQDIPSAQIRVVATATLRLAKNADVFVQKASEILGNTVKVIQGEEEARLIYQGVAHTTGGPDQRLVVDIGEVVPSWLQVPVPKPLSYLALKWVASLG